MAFKGIKLQKMAIGVVGQRIMFYGGNESGKTIQAIELGKRICAEVSNNNPEIAPYVIQFENGTNACFDYYPVDGTDYGQVLEFISWLTPNNANLKKKRMEEAPVVIVDGAEKIKTIAAAYTTDKKNVESLGDLAYGKGYQIYRSYTDSPFIKLMSSGVTVIFVFHDENGKYTDADGTEHENYTFPMGSGKDASVAQYIKDNCDFIFYLDKNTNDNGTKTMSIAHCAPTKDYFARNRYAMGTEEFTVEPFTADGIYDYVKACGEGLAKSRGVKAVTMTEKKEALKQERSHDELVADVKEIGAKLFKTSAKERAKEILNEYIEANGVEKFTELSDEQLAKVITDYSTLASEKGVEI